MGPCCGSRRSVGFGSAYAPPRNWPLSSSTQTWCAPIVKFSGSVSSARRDSSAASLKRPDTDPVMGHPVMTFPVVWVQFDGGLEFAFGSLPVTKVNTD